MWTAVIISAIVVGVIGVDRPVSAVDRLIGSSDNEVVPAPVSIRCAEELHAHDRVAKENRKETGHDDYQSWKRLDDVDRELFDRIDQSQNPQYEE